MTAETKTATNVEQAVPFFRVSDMEVSLRFYVDGLRFQMTKKWIDEGKLRWCWLELGGAALMLQEFRKAGHDSWVPSGKVGEGVTIYFQCKDALALYREFTSRGILTKEPFVGERDVGSVFVGSGWIPDRVRESDGCAGGDEVVGVAELRDGLTGTVDG